VHEVRVDSIVSYTKTTSATKLLLSFLDLQQDYDHYYAKIMCCVGI